MNSGFFPSANKFKLDPHIRHIPYVGSMVNYVVGPSTEVPPPGPSLSPPMSAVPSLHLEKERDTYHTTRQPAIGISTPLVYFKFAALSPGQPKYDCAVAIRKRVATTENLEKLFTKSSFSSRLFHIY